MVSLISYRAIGMVIYSFIRIRGVNKVPVFNSSPTASLGNMDSGNLATGAKESSVYFFEIAGHFEAFWGA